MKKILLLLLFFSAALYINSQTTKKVTYLIVRIDYDYNKSSESPFYKIYAEQGNPFAKEVYALIPFKTDKKAINTGGAYYYERTDTSKVFYNYFKNVTEAFLFLSENNWELVNIYTQITSSYETTSGGNYPYTTVSSYPVYYFRKSIE